MAVFWLCLTLETTNAADDANELVGTWTIKKVTRDCHDAGKDQSYNITELQFSGDDITIKWPRRVAKSKYKLGPRQTPRVIKLIHQEKLPYSAAAKESYEFNGDILKLALGPPDNRQTEISDTNQYLFVLVRKKSPPDNTAP